MLAKLTSMAVLGIEAFEIGIEADITDFEALTQALDGVDYVYHTAAFVSFDPRERHTMNHELPSCLNTFQ